jgi:hypothetical protein
MTSSKTLLSLQVRTPIQKKKKIKKKKKEEEEEEEEEKKNFIREISAARLLQFRQIQISQLRCLYVSAFKLSEQKLGNKNVADQQPTDLPIGHEYDGLVERRLLH